MQLQGSPRGPRASELLLSAESDRLPALSAPRSGCLPMGVMVAYIRDSQNEKEFSPSLCQHKTLKEKLVLGKMYLERSE